MVSLADKVFEQLEQDILTERYPAGEVLTEGKLSQTLGVSRTPIREAVRRLEQEGLLRESGKGMVVVGVTTEDLKDIYEIRRRLEGLAARRAAESDDEGLHQKLLEALELQEFYTTKGDAAKIQTLDSLFHKTIFENCGSEVLKDTLSTMHRRVQRFRRDSVTDMDRAALAVQEHRAIYDAIVSGNGDYAEALTVTHILNAYNNIMKQERN